MIGPLTVVGLGSRAGADDAIGLELVASLNADVAHTLWEDADALTLAHELLSLQGPVLLVDAADLRAEAGSSRLLADDEARLGVCWSSASTHGFGLAEALQLARTLGYQAPVHVFGVQPFDLSPRARLSSPMSARLPQLRHALRGAVDTLLSRPVRMCLRLRGAVQGVGFRPSLARLAAEAGLGGSVRNDGGVVRLCLEGPDAAVRALLAALPTSLPARARLDTIELESWEPLDQPAASFQILRSDGVGQGEIATPPDLAACPACLAEVFDPADRRFGYAFGSCTDCGPRWSVRTGSPYDRDRTTLVDFPLCADCAAEYADPTDRRFHAQSMACPRCGPRLWWVDAQGRRDDHAPLRAARAALWRGETVAVRGLGGYQLLCRADDPQAVRRLRTAKQRPHKPLAVMVDDLTAARRLCQLPPPAAELLSSPVAPIVLLQKHAPEELLAPDSDRLGLMLPTTPLHRLLLRPLPGDPTPAFEGLVVTSGNRPGEPICLGNEAARALPAQGWLAHDREISGRVDDSVCLLRHGQLQVWRRARGLAPEPLRLATPLTHSVLAFGAELKSTLTMGWGDQLLCSPHLGDLGSPASVDALLQMVDRLLQASGQRPERVAVDLHPDLHANRLGRRWAEQHGLPLVAVQHHHAHAAACMAEHGLSEALALVFDGTGWGGDGTIWGGELLHVTPGSFSRLAQLEAVPLPGGDAAVREPLRQLAGRFAQQGATLSEARLRRLGVTPEAWRLWQHQAQRSLNAPLSSAMGRAFDAAAALLGLASTPISYEGQAAIRLEQAAARHLGPVPSLPLGVEGGVVRLGEALLALAELDGRDLAAAAWHDLLARAAVAMVQHGRAIAGGDSLLLSGGVFANQQLLDRLVPRLHQLGLRVLEHRRVPGNDGGISVGQAVVVGVR